MDKNKELFLVLSELFNNLDLTSNVFIFIFFPKDFVTPTDKAAVFEVVV